MADTFFANLDFAYVGTRPNDQAVEQELFMSSALGADEVAASGIQKIGLTYEALNTGDVNADYPLVAIHNTDDVNFVDVSLDGGTTDHLIIADGNLMFFSPTLPVHLKADTAAVHIQYWVFGS